MADENNEQQPSATDGTKAEQTTEAPTEELGEAGKKALEEERKARKTAEKAAKAYEARLKELEDKDKSEAEKLAERATNAEKTAAEAHKQYLRLKVGVDKGLPTAVADRLQGETEEDMAADADRLLEVLKPGKPKGDADGGSRGSTSEGGSDMNSLLRAAARGE